MPTINDNGFSLWESRAIITYLVEKYANNDALYPKDVEKRAAINQRLQFDVSLFATFENYYYEKASKDVNNQTASKKLEEAVEYLNTFLAEQTYVAGNTLTLADFTLTTTVSSIEALHFDLSKYSNVLKWFAHVKTVIPYDLHEKYGWIVLE